ncbi:hypothetical protein I4U23_005225 [Adineta vaga]|nr:hypothetical protein I4U23_005225 [Adineta vaga]
MGTLTHEFIYRSLFEYQTETKQFYTNQTHLHIIEVQNIWCVTSYTHSIQNYNTAILFFHIIAPFCANLFSALFIVFRIARQRSVSQNRSTYRQHIHQQFNEQKQLLISPVILLILSLPRLIISLLPGCLKTTDNLWLYLFAYFISFTPAMLIFVTFVLPSEMYMKIFKESVTSYRRR